MKFKVFVDGQHGTTGLKIHELLEKRDEIELLEIDEKDKKNLENVVINLLSRAIIII